MKTLKLVGLDTYIGPATNGELLVKGATVTVEDDIAEHMLSQATTDELDNEHPYFQEVESDDGGRTAPGKAGGRRGRSAPSEGNEAGNDE